MRLKSTAIAATILTLSGCAAINERGPSFEQAGKGALGAAVGGAVGNQVGGGRGRTAATAAGAGLGVVIASGCKVGVGTVAGGMLGGLLGSQAGGGNGKNAMAGIGAALGALFGSDCSPGANLAKPTAIANAQPININGLRLTPVTGFSPEAFGGISPIVVPEDISAASRAVKLFADDAKASFAAGNTERALLSMYWAKRISTTTMGILNSSLQAINNNSGKNVKVPSKALIILPAFNEPRQADTTVALLGDLYQLEQEQQASYFADRVQIADNSGFGNVADFLRRASDNAKAKPTILAQSKSAPASIITELAGIPKNVVYQLADGTQVMKSDDALTIYNPGDAEITLPLDQLDFMPRTPELSAARQAATAMMYKMREGQMKWAFGTYAARSGGDFNTIIQKPNKILDLARNRREVGYFNASGEIDSSPDSGVTAYRSNAPYKRAIDTLDAVDQASPIRLHANGCLSSHHSHYTALGGMYANQLQAVCFDGNYSAPRPLSIKTFYIGEGKEIVQTMESLMKDKAAQKAMENAMVNGKTASDLLSFAPVAGNLESGLQCLGTYTISQYQAASIALGGDTLKDKSILNAGRAIDAAKLAGWTPPEPEEWSLDRVANCVGAIPLAGTAAGVVKGAGLASAKLGANVLAGLGSKLDTIRRITGAFENPLTYRQFMNGVKTAEGLVPGNPAAGKVVKAVYDSLMTGQNMSQTYDGMQSAMGDQA